MIAQSLLPEFDQEMKSTRALLEWVLEHEASWTLENGGEVVFSLPKVAVIRSFVMNHMIHHGGQLTVYCRLRNVPFPSIHCPTADFWGGS